jgi:hypothetical protein
MSFNRSTPKLVPFFSSVNGTSNIGIASKEAGRS